MNANAVHMQELHITTEPVQFEFSTKIRIQNCWYDLTLKYRTNIPSVAFVKNEHHEQEHRVIVKQTVVSAERLSIHLHATGINFLFNQIEATKETAMEFWTKTESRTKREVSLETATDIPNKILVIQRKEKKDNSKKKKMTKSGKSAVKQAGKNPKHGNNTGKPSKKPEETQKKSIVDNKGKLHEFEVKQQAKDIAKMDAMQATAKPKLSTIKE